MKDRLLKFTIFTLLVASILMLIFGWPTTRTEETAQKIAGKVRVAAEGDRYLRAWYAQFNEQLFYSQLPSDTNVIWEDLTEVGALGEMSSIGNNKFQIELDPNYNVAPVTAQETLIHEMCHVEVISVENDETDSLVHGPKFYGCMLRIAQHNGLKGIW